MLADPPSIYSPVFDPSNFASSTVSGVAYVAQNNAFTNLNTFYGGAVIPANATLRMHTNTAAFNMFATADTSAPVYASSFSTGNNGFTENITASRNKTTLYNNILRARERPTDSQRFDNTGVLRQTTAVGGTTFAGNVGYEFTSITITGSHVMTIPQMQSRWVVISTNTDATLKLPNPNTINGSGAANYAIGSVVSILNSSKFLVRLLTTNNGDGMKSDGTSVVNTDYTFDPPIGAGDVGSFMYTGSFWRRLERPEANTYATITGNTTFNANSLPSTILAVLTAAAEVVVPLPSLVNPGTVMRVCTTQDFFLTINTAPGANPALGVLTNGFMFPTVAWPGTGNATSNKRAGTTLSYGQSVTFMSIVVGTNRWWYCIASS